MGAIFGVADKAVYCIGLLFTYALLEADIGERGHTFIALSVSIGIWLEALTTLAASALSHWLGKEA